MTLSQLAVPSPIGRWVVEGDADGLTKIYQPSEMVGTSLQSASPVVRSAARQLEEYFTGRRRYFDVDLHLTGSAFEQEVWLALSAIPFGEVATYGDIASAVGRPLAYRAVGNANGKNPWPVVVPCHRVVAAHGLGGYGGGLDVKRFLLQLEGVTSPR